MTKKKWKCNTCKKQKTESDPGIECDLCKEWIGLECTTYTTENYNLLREEDIEINFLCKSCKATIPELRNLLEITKQQQHIKEDLVKHDTRITKCELEMETLGKMKEDTASINSRLADLEAKLIDTKTVETIAERCFKDTDFPPMAVQDVRKHKETTQKLEAAIKQERDDRVEEKRREDNKNNLIVYGVPEQHDDETDQMKADFATLKDLYQPRVNIYSKDLLQVTRLGQKKENQIRPIKLTFADIQKKSEVLRNNKNLKLYIDENECELDFCDEEDNHKHVYITTDKTRQQRDEEKKLRGELKERKRTDADLIIRNGKIIKKSTNQARWIQIGNGL